MRSRSCLFVMSETNLQRCLQQYMRIDHVSNTSACAFTLLWASAHMPHSIVLTICRLVTAAQAVLKFAVSRGTNALQASQLHQQPALGQNLQHTKLQSLGPNLAQHVTSGQLSARVAMVCLMYQLTALLTNKHAAAHDHHQEQAQNRTAAGSNTVAKGATKCCHYTAALKSLPTSLMLLSSACCFSGH